MWYARLAVWFEVNVLQLASFFTNEVCRLSFLFYRTRLSHKMLCETMKAFFATDWLNKTRESYGFCSLIKMFIMFLKKKLLLQTADITWSWNLCERNFLYFCYLFLVSHIGRLYFIISMYSMTVIYYIYLVDPTASSPDWSHTG